MKYKHDDSEEVVTKGFLRSKLQKGLDVVRIEAKQYRDQILSRLDSVMKEAEDHERRIIKLERTQKAA